MSRAKAFPAIRFLLPWRGRLPGQINSELDGGVRQMLVQRRIAEVVSPERRSRRGKDE